MQPKFDPQKPIFQSIAEWLEDAILSGVYEEEGQVPSTTDISMNYNINPATALKGVNLLVEAGILYKRRGLGMFVAAGAKAKLLSRRQQQFFDSFAEPLIGEARRLQISKQDLITMIERGYDK